MTLMDVITKLGIGKTEITVEQQQKDSSINEQTKPVEQQKDISINEQTKPVEQHKDSSADEQQAQIDSLLKEITELKAANQQLMLGTAVKKEPTIEESILDLAGLGGLFDGE